MSIIESLRVNLKRDPKDSDIAGHFADRISAMEQQQRIARCDGDIDLLINATQKNSELRKEARGFGLNDEKYPEYSGKYPHNLL